MLVSSACPPVPGALGRMGVPGSSSASNVVAVAATGSRFPCFRFGVKRCPCGIYSSKARATAELAEGRELKERAEGLRGVAIPASYTGAGKETSHLRSFLNARTEEELLCHIRKEAEIGRIPSNVAAGLHELYHSYRNAVLQSGDPKANEIILSNMAVTFDRILLDLEDPFTFPPYHKAIREPFDYYMFGQNYLRPLMDLRKSYIGNVSIFYDVEEKIRQGHNVILISNHQSEADPAIISLLLEKTNPYISENMTYVAGDRVVTDPLCKPFSMGRNLVCVFSKKRMYDIPELAEMKRRANTRSLKEMALLLRTGGQIIWIAPSGGRDRPDPVTGEWYPAAFDASSINNIRRLANSAGVPRHIHPLALLCYDIMPPPPQVQKQIGEQRVVSFQGAGLSIGPQMDFNEVTADCRNPEEAEMTFSDALYNSTCEQYGVLKSAIYGCQGLDASNSLVSLSQPWA